MVQIATSRSASYSKRSAKSATQSQPKHEETQKKGGPLFPRHYNPDLRNGIYILDSLQLVINVLFLCDVGSLPTNIVNVQKPIQITAAR